MGGSGMSLTRTDAEAARADARRVLEPDGGGGGSSAWQVARCDLPSTTVPLFVDPVWGDPTTGGDYRLLPESPVRDRGDNAANSTTTDLDGNPRIVGSAIDLGAYEVQS